MKLKEEKGITLVALIITIIVLIILAVVTVTQMFNEGLVEKTSNASEQYKSSEDRESIMIAINQALLETISGTEISAGVDFSYEDMPEKIEEALRKSGFTVEKDTAETEGDNIFYNITRGNRPTFKLRINKVTGEHDLITTE